MPGRATFSVVSNKSTYAISNWDEACGINSRGLGRIHPREPSLRTNGWLGSTKGDTSPEVKMLLSIWDIVGSIGTAIRKGRARLYVRSYFGESRVGLIHKLGVFWKEWTREMKRISEENRQKQPRREVTEELSCRTSVCPVCGKNKKQHQV